MDSNTSSEQESPIPQFDIHVLKGVENYYNATNLLLYIKSCQEQLLKDEEKLLKVYTDGAFDSSQTLFERLSNHLQIGVKASSKKFGVCLLRLLRCQIDSHHYFDFFWCILDDKEIKKLLKSDGDIDIDTDIEISWDKIIDVLDENFNNYVSEFDLGGTAEATLYGWELSESSSGTGKRVETIIKRPTKEIALWGVDDLLKFAEEISD